MKKLKPIKPICVTVERTPVYEEKKLTITTENPDGTEKKETQEVNVAPDKTTRLSSTPQDRLRLSKTQKWHRNAEEKESLTSIFS